MMAPFSDGEVQVLFVICVAAVGLACYGLFHLVLKLIWLWQHVQITFS